MAVLSYREMPRVGRGEIIRPLGNSAPLGKKGKVLKP